MPYCCNGADVNGQCAPGLPTTAADILKAAVRSYPAGFATESPKYNWDAGQGTCVAVPATPEDPYLHPAYSAVLSVGASGSGSNFDFDYSCKAEHSNFGDWVNITAPGTNILSTTPWDRPFTMNTEDGLAARYDYSSASSLAAAFASGVAARAWGHLSITQPSVTNAGVAEYVKWSGSAIVADDVCWPGSMAGVTDANVAAALNRGALTAGAFDAVTGLPLIGATIQAIQGTSVKTTAVLTAGANCPAGYLNLPASADLINLPSDWTPAPPHTTLKVNKSGYTSTATNAFVGSEGNWNSPLGEMDGTTHTPWGWLGYGGYAAVPPKSARFTAVSAWDVFEDRPPPRLTTQLPVDDLRGNFIVGYDVCGNTSLEGETAGELSDFPYAQELYPYVHEVDGDWVGNLWDTHQIVQRSGAQALPNYPGEYVFRVYNGTMDFDTRQGSLLIWKDGALKGRVDCGCSLAGDDWWEAAKIESGASGSAVITKLDACMNTAAIDFPGTCGP
jgi:hypothetical protein